MGVVLAKDDGLGREGWTSGDSDGVGGQNAGLRWDGSVLRQGWWTGVQGGLGFRDG